jgi:hypothetical protein
VLIAILHVQKRVLFFVRPLTSTDARERILSANKGILSLQISGGEFTSESADAYEAWLRIDPDRRLNIAFANPDNSELLLSIIRLTRIDKATSEDEALRHLHEVIIKSLAKYTGLRDQLPGQVEVKVYDCSPPFSIHAVDPTSSRGSIYLEFYLPHVPAGERPSTIIRARHKKFLLYASKSQAWFSNSTPARSTDADSSTGA